MLKEYIQAGHQNQPPEAQAKIVVDLMMVNAYIRTPGQNYVSFCGPGFSNLQVYMTPADYDEFKLHLKTAKRLKSAYE